MADITQLRNEFDNLLYSLNAVRGSGQESYYQGLVDAKRAEIITSTPTLTFVAGLYRTYYHREPDVPGLIFWAGQIDSGAHTQSSAQSAFSTSPDQSPNGGALNDYLVSQGLAPVSGGGSGSGSSSGSGSGSGGSGSGSGSSGSGSGSESPGLLDSIGLVAVELPMVGPWLLSGANATGIHPGILALVAVGVGLYAANSFGMFDDGGKKRR